MRWSQDAQYCTSCRTSRQSRMHRGRAVAMYGSKYSQHKHAWTRDSFENSDLSQDPEQSGARRRPYYKYRDKLLLTASLLMTSRRSPSPPEHLKDTVSHLRDPVVPLKRTYYHSPRTPSDQPDPWTTSLVRQRGEKEVRCTSPYILDLNSSNFIAQDRP